MSKTILIAEDEAALREALASLLTDEGYDVMEAADGRAAYQQILDRPFDVILSDFRMPNMDGLEFLQHVRQLDVETPFILMTAFGTIENAVAAMRKPVTSTVHSVAPLASSCGPAVIFTVYFWFAVLGRGSVVSVTYTVNVKVPAAVARPESVPFVGSRVTPVGRLRGSVTYP